MIKLNFKKMIKDYVMGYISLFVVVVVLNLIIGAFVGITDNTDSNPANYIEQKIEKENNSSEFLDKNFKSIQADLEKADLEKATSKLFSFFVYIPLIFGVMIIFIAIFKIIAFGETQKTPLLLMFSLIMIAFWFFTKSLLLGEANFGFGFDKDKFTDFIKSGFYYIHISFLIILATLKAMLTYMYIRSKNLYWLSNCYIKAYNNNSEMLDYFDCEQKINPNDMGRNLAKYFV